MGPSWLLIRFQFHILDQWMLTEYDDSLQPINPRQLPWCRPTMRMIWIFYVQATKDWLEMSTCEESSHKFPSLMSTNSIINLFLSFSDFLIFNPCAFALTSFQLLAQPFFAIDPEIKSTTCALPARSILSGNNKFVLRTVGIKRHYWLARPERAWQRLHYCLHEAIVMKISIDLRVILLLS